MAETLYFYLQDLHFQKVDEPEKHLDLHLSFLHRQNPLFSLNLAHTNDFVPKTKFVAAGGGLQLIFGFGAISGPILCSIFMGWFGLNGFFIFLILIHGLIGAFGLYRMRVRETVENPDSTFTPVPATITPAGLELDPDAPATLDQNSSSNETQKTFG